MYQEFNRISGKTSDPDMYFKEVEPTYMTFDWMEKEYMAIMYWGEKKGAYELWVEGNTLYKEKLFITGAIQNMRDCGFTKMASEYEARWQQKADAYRAKVEKMMKKKT